MAIKIVTARLTFRLECELTGQPTPIVGIWYNHESAAEEALYTWNAVGGFFEPPDDERVAEELSRLCVLFLAELLTAGA